MNAWRGDDHEHRGAPSLAVIPPPGHSTLRQASGKGHQPAGGHLQSSTPGDSSEKPGWVLTRPTTRCHSAPGRKQRRTQKSAILPRPEHRSCMMSHRLSHPEPSSFNAALKNVAVETILSSGHRAEGSDLYAEKLNPVAGRHDFDGRRSERSHYQKRAALCGDSRRLLERICSVSRSAAPSRPALLQFPLWWRASRDPQGWFDRCLLRVCEWRTAGASTRASSRVRRPHGRGHRRNHRPLLSPDGGYGRSSARVLWPVRRLTLE